MFCCYNSVFCVFPDESAVAAAKLVLLLSIMNMKLPSSDFIPRVSRYCFEEWQDMCINNKLCAIYQIVGNVDHNKSLSRHETAIINRL